MGSKTAYPNSGGGEVRKGPWTLEEDTLLINYIGAHGEGRWSSAARSAGLKRNGKSCRLRWLNYLKPDIKRGNLTPHEQFLILQLQSKWGNRWSKIAQQLPGRTDNEIKNYWRTRVQKQAKQLKINSNSNKFFEAVNRLWMPRLLEKMDQNSPSSSSSSSASSVCTNGAQSSKTPFKNKEAKSFPNPSPQSSKLKNSSNNSINCSLDSTKLHQITKDDCYRVDISSLEVEGYKQPEKSPVGNQETFFSDCQVAELDWIDNTFGNIDELWQFRMAADNYSWKGLHSLRD